MRNNCRWCISQYSYELSKYLHLLLQRRNLKIDQNKELSLVTMFFDRHLKIDHQKQHLAGTHVFLADQNEMSNFCEGPTSFLPRFVQFASVVSEEMIKMWKVNRRMDDRRWMPSDGKSWHWWPFSSGELKMTLYFDNLYFLEKFIKIKILIICTSLIYIYMYKQSTI